MKIYTRKGDSGETGLFHGGRVAKDGSGPEAYGAVDEAVAALGVARSIAADAVAADILEAQRALFVVAAELATDPGRRDRLQPGVSLATQQLIDALEAKIDAIEEGSGLPTEFVVPGGDPVAAAIDVARTVVRRAERRAVTHLRGVDGSLVVPYLNRLSDYLYALARAVEGDWVPSRVEEGT
jgi:cob(I)alamin adenosyltransferase